MAGLLRQGDVGSIIRVQVLENGAPFDASTATVTTLKLRRPSGSVLEAPAVFETDGSDGVVTYTTAADDLNEAGPWVGQVYLQFATGRWHSDQFSLQVGEILS